MGGGGTGEVEAVAAHSDADTVHFGFSWSDGGDHLGVCDFAAMGGGGFCYKEYGVPSGGRAGYDALGEAF